MINIFPTILWCLCSSIHSPLSVYHSFFLACKFVSKNVHKAPHSKPNLPNASISDYNIGQTLCSFFKKHTKHIRQQIYKYHLPVPKNLIQYEKSQCPLKPLCERLGLRDPAVFAEVRPRQTMSGGRKSEGGERLDEQEAVIVSQQSHHLVFPTWNWSKINIIFRI